MRDEKEMSMRGRKERIQDLHFRILDKCSIPTEEGKASLPNKIMKKLHAKFILEHGLTDKTFYSYVEVLKNFGILQNNFEIVFNDFDATWDEEKGQEIPLDDVLMWFVDTKKKLPYWEK